MWPFNRRRAHISTGFEPICYGPVRSDQVDRLAKAGYAFLRNDNDTELGPNSSHPAIKLLPQFLALVRILTGTNGVLTSLKDDVSVVVGVAGCVRGSHKTQALAVRTDDYISVPSSFAIQLSAGALADLFDRSKGLLIDGRLLRALPRAGLPDIGSRDKPSNSLMRSTISAFLLLYFHEVAHVLRDHHALSESKILEEQSDATGQPDYASLMRVLENAADFIAMGLLARFIRAVPPSLKLEENPDRRVELLWCLLASFCLFSVLADSSPAGDAKKINQVRIYYSPLVRHRVLPLAASSNLGLSIDVADQTAKSFAEVLQAIHGELPVLANYRLWKALFDADLEHWKETERKRVSWQSEGRFYALMRQEARP